MYKLLSAILFFLFFSFTETKAQEYNGALSVGYNFGVGYNGESSFSADMYNGIKFQDTYSVGVNFGTRIYSELDGILIPIQADFRWYFLNNFWQFNVGYSFDAKHQMNDVGIIFGSKIGTRVKLNDHLKCLVGVGFETQNMDVITSELKIDNINSTAINISLGIEI
ncbi:hypothetical protein [Flammeovirga sp. SJP92]|uniref:hypothetical protein n=1 Tax=Flammeovirga sp. SJP92 TaxID=1775430 RepID=UPI00078783DF|nr:hypothetical protein [Flammeovirga sp. SJP92]KXX72740.1 hypothetical protein AVL50_32080 [Flammeovirga sp. SJP92]